MGSPRGADGVGVLDVRMLDFHYNEGCDGAVRIDGPLR